MDHHASLGFEKLSVKHSCLAGAKEAESQEPSAFVLLEGCKSTYTKNRGPWKITMKGQTSQNLADGFKIAKNQPVEVASWSLRGSTFLFSTSCGSRCNSIDIFRWKPMGENMEDAIDIPLITQNPAKMGKNIRFVNWSLSRTSQLQISFGWQWTPLTAGFGCVMSMGLLVSSRTSMRILSCRKKISSFIFRSQKMVKGWTYIIAGFQMLQFFLGMRVFCLKYPFSHRKWFSGKKAPNPRDLPILKWTMGRVKALAGSWVWTAAVGWRGGSLTRKRPVKIALRYIEVGRRTSVFF